MRTEEVADLANFLRARLDEDDAAAQAANSGATDDTTDLKARVLADVAAKRGVLRFVAQMQRNAENDDFMVHGPAMIALSTMVYPLRHLAAAYPTHPDYQPEWQPNDEELKPDPRFSRTGRA
ncbi:DUF6221 family protein [Streptomyces albidoflavus]